MNIDSLGPETVDEYFRRGLIHNIADLYDIKVEDISAGGSKLRSAQKIVKAIDDSKKVPFERVVFALGIRFVGETSARLIARHFGDIDTLMNASLQQLLEVEGVGEVIAKSIITYFHNDTNRSIVERLRAYGLQMAVEKGEEQGGSDVLAGKSIVISGVFQHHSRDEYKAIIERNGGKNVGSISGKTSFILAGDNMGPSKLQKAEKLGVAIVDEETFLKMIEGSATEDSAIAEDSMAESSIAESSATEGSANESSANESSANESTASESSATEGSSGHSESQNEGSASSNVQKETSKASSKGGGEQLLLFED